MSFLGVLGFDLFESLRGKDNLVKDEGMELVDWPRLSSCNSINLVIVEILCQKVITPIPARSISH